jgi:hypothetical protein
VDLQFEAVRQQRLEHLSQLGTTDAVLCFGHDVVVIAEGVIEPGNLPDV